MNDKTVGPASDRELLEMAAKAYQANNSAWREDMNDLMRGAFMDKWNPLFDDSHALRLAAELDLDISFFPSFGEVQVSDQHLIVNISELTGVDKMAATRRAIVRAAAAIGSAM
jgi:hypothetical protein